MTLETLREFFKAQLLAAKSIKGKDADTLVNYAVSIGLNDFWHASRWALKETDTTVTTVAGTETVDLPDDFDGILSVIEKTTTHGRKLINMGPDEYDRLVPYSASNTNDTPEYYKIYYNVEDSVWKLALYPTPNAAITLYIKYHAVPRDVPDKYMSAIVPIVWKYVHAPGSKEYWGARMEAEAAIARLKMVDTPEVSTIDQFQDAGTKYEPHVQQWYEDP